MQHISRYLRADRRTPSNKYPVQWRARQKSLYIQRIVSRTTL